MNQKDLVAAANSLNISFSSTRYKFIAVKTKNGVMGISINIANDISDYLLANKINNKKQTTLLPVDQLAFPIELATQESLDTLEQTVDIMLALIP